MREKHLEVPTEDDDSLMAVAPVWVESKFRYFPHSMTFEAEKQIRAFMGNHARVFIMWLGFVALILKIRWYLFVSSSLIKIFQGFSAFVVKKVVDFPKKKKEIGLDGRWKLDKKLNIYFPFF